MVTKRVKKYEKMMIHQHAKLIHVNPMYVMKLQWVDLINMHDKQSKKCETCIESKLTKKTCFFVQWETDLVDLKQTMTGGGTKLLQRHFIEYFIFQLCYY